MDARRQSDNQVLVHQLQQYTIWHHDPRMPYANDVTVPVLERLTDQKAANPPRRDDVRH